MFFVVAVVVVVVAAVVAETAIDFVTAALLTDEQRKHLTLTRVTLVADAMSLEHHQLEHFGALPEAESGFARGNGFPSMFDLEEIVLLTVGSDFLGQKYLRNEFQ